MGRSDGRRYQPGAQPRTPTRLAVVQRVRSHVSIACRHYKPSFDYARRSRREGAQIPFENTPTGSAIERQPPATRTRVHSAGAHSNAERPALSSAHTPLLPSIGLKRIQPAVRCGHIQQIIRLNKNAAASTRALKGPVFISRIRPQRTDQTPRIGHNHLPFPHDRGSPYRSQIAPSPNPHTVAFAQRREPSFRTRDKIQRIPFGHRRLQRIRNQIFPPQFVGERI